VRGFAPWDAARGGVLGCGSGWKRSIAPVRGNARIEATELPKIALDILRFAGIRAGHDSGLRFDIARMPDVGPSGRIKPTVVLALADRPHKTIALIPAIRVSNLANAALKI
jgi:hypothetical protein